MDNKKNRSHAPHSLCGDEAQPPVPLYATVGWCTGNNCFTRSQRETARRREGWREIGGYRKDYGHAYIRKERKWSKGKRKREEDTGKKLGAQTNTCASKVSQQQRVLTHTNLCRSHTSRQHGNPWCNITVGHDTTVWQQTKQRNRCTSYCKQEQWHAPKFERMSSYIPCDDCVRS